jgi:hypothetical protein
VSTKKGRKFGRWAITRDLGQGGQGWTYLAVEDGRQDAVPHVLKRLKNINRINRFRREIDAGLHLSHPNIVRVVDSNPDTDPAYIVTEYCPGGALSPAAVTGKTLSERLSMIRAICVGVMHAHTQGVVHRDLKPDNIFLQADGTPTVGDFGLCFFEESGERFTLLEEAVGPRWYMAPELESGRVHTVLPASDVYSLGKLLYWMLATRIFARERHREPEYDLCRNSADFGMRLVYELLDRMLADDPSQRPTNAGAVVTELDTILRRIALRSRAIELARAPVPAYPQEVRIVSFRRGSIPTWQSFDPGSANVLGFAARGRLLAAWGVAGHGENAGECLVWVGGPQGGWETRAVPLANPYRPQAEGYQPLFVDDRGALLLLLLVVSTPGQDGVGSAHLVRIAGGAPTAEVFAMNCAAPRHCAVASGPGDRVAGYLGGWEAAPDEMMGLTIIREPAGEARHQFSPHTNFPGPLAFDEKGVLHQAAVVSSPAGKHELRELRYLWKVPGEGWREEVVDSTGIRGSFGEFTVEGSMSAHICLAVNPAGHPVIVTSGKGYSTRMLSVYVKDAAFTTHEIDLQPSEASFGLDVVDTSSTKQLLFDEEGTAHLALFSSGGNSSEVIYLALDEQWRVIEQRDFPASDFLGMGIDGSGTLYVAIR